MWKKDGVTDRFRKEHAELLKKAPREMTMRELTLITTYHNDLENEYSLEIARRGGDDAFLKFRSIFATPEEKLKVLQKIAKAYGIYLV